jgi:beta-lactamase superfamily II metal-dependent hydrolase
VLKVSHHGSSSSTTKAFLKAISPEYAVISMDNYYGHPTPHMIARLNDAGVKIFRTDLQGTKLRQVMVKELSLIRKLYQ